MLIEAYSALVCWVPPALELENFEERPFVFLEKLISSLAPCGENSSSLRRAELVKGTIVALSVLYAFARAYEFCGF